MDLEKVHKQGWIENTSRLPYYRKIMLKEDSIEDQSTDKSLQVATGLRICPCDAPQFLVEFRTWNDKFKLKFKNYRWVNQHTELVLHLSQCFGQ